MPQLETVPRFTGALQRSSRGGTGRVDTVSATTTHRGQPFEWALQAVRPNLFRTTFCSPSHPLPPFPSAALPAAADGSPPPQIALHGSSSSAASITTSAGVRLDVTLDNGPPHVAIALDHAQLQQDLPFRGYVVDGPGVCHYTAHDRFALHLGLGEKAAPMDLTGRAFRIAATDSFGYNVHHTDPLYKHIPLLITARPHGVVAQFSTSHARGFWSVGCEMDGLWGRSKVYRQDYGGLEEYTIVGKTIPQVVRAYADLVGYPLLVPRWSFGYIAGGYKYTMLDEPRACDALVDFADKLRQHDIPCSAFQMSSGYHVRSEEPCVRNVFVWNRHRFPDPEAWIRDYHARGIRLIANVKPFLLEAHPDFAQLRAQQAFFTDPDTNAAGYMRLWSNGGGESGEGCHLDFTSQAAFDWWYRGVQGLRKQGIDVPWNDNNEYVVSRDDWTMQLDAAAVQDRLAAFAAAGHSDKSLGLWGRAMHTELMAKASHDALRDLEPRRRPFVLTRSATAGTMRYACSSWSGDNVTSWDSMRGANALSLNAGMSLLQCSGHDIGGFEGPQPSPELLVRWVQIGAHSPRFAINCFKTSPDNNKVGEVIEPWMHPHVTHLVRAAIKRRYQLIPLLYSLSLESHLHAAPPQRWVGWGFEHDHEVWSSSTLREGETQYWLGDTLIVGGVFAPGGDSAELYLPHRPGYTDDGYLDTHLAGGYLPAGAWATIASHWQASIPVVARVGGGVPVGKSVQVKSVGETLDPVTLPSDDYRALEVFPPQGASAKRYLVTWLEDDGIAQEPDISRFYVEYASTPDQVVVSFGGDAENKFEPAWAAVTGAASFGIVLPLGDTRTVHHRESGAVPAQSKREPDGRLESVFEWAPLQQSRTLGDSNGDDA